MMAQNVAMLVRSVLGSPQSELAMRRQVVELARQNLHEPDVLPALIEALPKVKDQETRVVLLAMLAEMDTSRFKDIEALYGAFLAVLAEEKERAVRATLIQRLAEGLHQDSRVAPMLLDALREKSLSDEERRAVTHAVASLPSIDEATAAAALQRCATAPADVQAVALSLAERCATWGAPVLKALAPYLDVKFDRAIRLRILRKLGEAKALTLEHLPLLRNVLRTDPDADARRAALDTIRQIKPWSEAVLDQLLWTAAKDSEASLRATAVAMQREMPQLTAEQVERLAGQLAEDHVAGVRGAVLETLRPYARDAAVRAAVAKAFAKNPSVFDDAEFTALVDFLSPYAGRDEKVRDGLFASLEGLPSATQRAKLLETVVPKVRIDQIVTPLAKLFAKERDDWMREALFKLIKPLSITKHPELVQAFVDELVEPSSKFRAACATILATAAEVHAEIPPALEDVLLHDQDRDLVRTCLEGYLRPKVARRFEPLLCIVGNETVDATSRQRALDELVKLQLTADQQKELADTLAGLKPNTLKLPR